MGDEMNAFHCVEVTRDQAARQETACRLISQAVGDQITWVQIDEIRALSANWLTIILARN